MENNINEYLTAQGWQPDDIEIFLARLRENDFAIISGEVLHSIVKLIDEHEALKVRHEEAIKLLSKSVKWLEKVKVNER